MLSWSAVLKWLPNVQSQHSGVSFDGHVRLRRDGPRWKAHVERFPPAPVSLKMDMSIESYTRFDFSKC